MSMSLTSIWSTGLSPFLFLLSHALFPLLIVDHPRGLPGPCRKLCPGRAPTAGMVSTLRGLSGNVLMATNDLLASLKSSAVSSHSGYAKAKGDASTCLITLRASYFLPDFAKFYG